MGKINVKDKDVVVPGEILATGMDSLPGIGTYREGENIIASRLGLVHIDGRTLKLIPLSGRYIPKKGDTIIAYYFYSDTIFRISEKNILKSFKRKYYLNMYRNSSEWEVKQLFLDNDTLWINAIAVDDKKLLEHLPTFKEKDTKFVSKYRIDPTKRQFKKFVKQGGFMDKEKYIKK